MGLTRTGALLGLLLMAATGCGAGAGGSDEEAAASRSPASSGPASHVPSAAPSTPAAPSNPPGTQPPRDTSAPANPAPLTPGGGGAGGGTGGSGGGRGDETPPLSRIPPPAGGPQRPPKGPSDQIKPLTVRGTLVLAHSGCQELVTDVSRYVLVGSDLRALRDGTELEVTGLPGPHLRTACNGIVLRVRQARKV